MSGSWMKASSMDSSESRLSRSTRMTRSHVARYVPSTPDTSIALTSMRVSRKGTRSGNLSRCMATSKQSPKSMCSTLPVRRSSIRFDGWRSPRPKMWPTMDMAASDRA